MFIKALEEISENFMNSNETKFTKYEGKKKEGCVHLNSQHIIPLK